MIGIADDHRPAGTRIEKTNPAQDQGAHDAFAQFGLFDHQIAQPARWNDEGLDRPLDRSIHEGRSLR
jgi:hypothetical protein